MEQNTHGSREENMVLQECYYTDNPRAGGLRLCKKWMVQKPTFTHMQKQLRAQSWNFCKRNLLSQFEIVEVQRCYSKERGSQDGRSMEESPELGTKLPITISTDLDTRAADLRGFNTLLLASAKKQSTIRISTGRHEYSTANCPYHHRDESVVMLGYKMNSNSSWKEQEPPPWTRKL